MRAFLMLTLVSLVAVIGCSDPPPPPAPPPPPMTSPPEPEKITADNADAAADALEKEIAGDAD
jgi:hypothetical protein